MRLQLLACLVASLASRTLQQDQIPMFDDILSDVASSATNSKPTLADLLTIETSASIFYTYARELELSALFSDTERNCTLFAPTNKAVMALARKPHQSSNGPSDAEIEITEEEFENMSKKNVQRWVSAHVVPESPISLDSHQHPTLLRHKSITFKPITKHDNKGPEWSRVTLEDGVRIVSMKEGLNGVLYLIDGTVSYD